MQDARVVRPSTRGQFSCESAAQQLRTGLGRRARYDDNLSDID
jgi:hypothetical protein